MLYVVATPIGNLSDISERALDTLRSVDLIAAEDTRVSKKLLSAYGIKTPLVSLHKFNERARSEELISRMRTENISVAYISDAGTPAVSDPGAILVDMAWNNAIKVQPIPGASAVVAALSISGFAESEFSFFGFLPRQKNELRICLQDIAKRAKIAVFYESPHRVTALCEQLHDLFPDCRLLLSCDLTKLYESSLRGSPLSMVSALKGNPKAEKGEYCVVVDFSGIVTEKEEEPSVSLEALLFDLVFKGETLKSAMQSLAQKGFKKNELYAASLRLKDYLQELSER